MREGVQPMLEKTRRRMAGTIDCWFGGEHGCGFIRPSDGKGEVVFVHHTDIAPNPEGKPLHEGARVTYEVTYRNIGGIWATNVRVMD